MILICAWCKAVQGEKEPLGDKRLTHGICTDCAEKIRQESRMTAAILNQTRDLQGAGHVANHR